MVDERTKNSSDWVIEVGSPAPALSSGARASLRQLALLSADIKTIEELLPISERVDALVRDAVAGGATENHIATDLRISLRNAERLTGGCPLSELLSIE